MVRNPDSFAGAVLSGAVFIVLAPKSLFLSGWGFPESFDDQVGHGFGVPLDRACREGASSKSCRVMPSWLNIAPPPAVIR
jgi:hypothetical protein